MSNGKTGSKKAAAASPAAADKPVDDGIKRVNLAFQGGGSHGAFTWGVADRLLEETSIEIEGISGTSAGAMNAAALAYGLHIGGREGARAKLEEFWMTTAESGKTSPIQRHPFDVLTKVFKLDNSPSFAMFEFLSRMMSPYQLNPMNFHPLRDVLQKVIDFDQLHACQKVRLFISATNVRSGKVRVFQTHEITCDVLLASACLPFMFQAIEIAGEHYWDGGYMGNPALYPLIYHSKSKDVIIVQINPLRREELPESARDIMDRVNEISFNSTLMREMRAVHFVTHLIDIGALDPNKYKRMNIHLVEDDENMTKLGASSKLLAEPEFLCHLRDLGRGAASRWLDKNYDMIGKESSIDLVKTWL